VDNRNQDSRRETRDAQTHSEACQTITREAHAFGEKQRQVVAQHTKARDLIDLETFL
jgi:hypothetical protein